MNRPDASTQEQRSWLGRHLEDHPVELVKTWPSVVALRGGPGQLWRCGCRPDGDLQWFHVKQTSPDARESVKETNE